MKKNDLIEIIEGTFPSDSPHDPTAKVGRELLNRAIEESGFNWRALPSYVLEVYSQLCVENQPVLFNINSIEDE